MHINLKSKFLAIKTIFLLVPLMAMFFNGCVARSYYYGKLDLPPNVDDHKIDIYLPGEIVPSAFDVVGIVQVDGYYGTGTETLIKGAQANARKKGGDAIVLGPVGQRVETYSMYYAGEPGYAGAAAVATPNGSAAVAVVKAPTPDRVVPMQVAWPTISAIILVYKDDEQKN